MIDATQPYFPSRKKYNKYLDKIWETGWLTNNSFNVQTLEERLITYLDVPNLSLLNNGTIALQIAIKALDLKGEIITTPFSYVATTSSIIWEGCEPVFADIEIDTFSIDAEKIKSSITPRTTAIMATHVYGNPCDIEAIQAIADAHGLKVIYDAAHAFGVKYKGRSVLSYGDVSTLSFHATKLFHTVEGGSVTAKDVSVAATMENQRRFGHDGPYAFHGIGINGKLSEPHAAFGLCVLDDIEEILAMRKDQWLFYLENLQGLPLEFLTIRNDVDYNYAYFPIKLPNETLLLTLLEELELKKIFPRRYFYPSLNQLKYTGRDSCPISEDVANRVLCLPLYHTLAQVDQQRIINILIDHLK